MFLTDNLTIMPLGAGNEVGRSCIHITYKSLSILLDCGVHPAYTGTASLPFLDLINLSTVDAVFITHFHLDHAGALPYLTEKTAFTGKVFMTHPTKAILRWLLNDYIRIINTNTEIDFYTEKDLSNCYDKIIAIDYNQTVIVKDFRVTALNAGHVLGAAMFMVENERFRMLYTGDYSTEEDRHLKGADTAWIGKYGQKDEDGRYDMIDTVDTIDTIDTVDRYGQKDEERRYDTIDKYGQKDEGSMINTTREDKYGQKDEGPIIDTSRPNKYKKTRENEHHLDVLICESTYGVQCHLPREERERRFTQIVNDIVTRGGKCLLPVFALGRAQELLLILEDYWERNPQLHNVPIYYASALANRCLSIYQAYTHMMNLKIKKDAFTFKHIRNLKSVDNHLIKNACVVMASPGMLQSGLSRELFESWCEDANNGTVIPGYCVQGTLAKEIMTEPKEIVAMNGHRLRLNMRVEYISFSAHVDYVQNTSFIEKCTPRIVMLVHGEVNEMMRLKAALEKRHSVLALKNGEMHEIEVRRESVAVGKNLVEGDIEGVVVNEQSGIRVYRRDELSCDLYQEMKILGCFDEEDEGGSRKGRGFNEGDEGAKGFDKEGRFTKGDKFSEGDGFNEESRGLGEKGFDKEGRFNEKGHDEGAKDFDKEDEGDKFNEGGRFKEKGNNEEGVNNNEEEEVNHNEEEEANTNEEEEVNHNVREQLHQTDNPLNDNLNLLTIKNTFNATPSLIKQHLLHFFPFIHTNDNSLSIQDIKLIIENEIVLIYRSTYVNDLLACTIVRLIERMVTKDSVKISKISKKSAIVKVLKNYYEVVENSEDVEICDGGRRVVISEKGIRGCESLIAEVKKIIKRVVSLL